MSFVHLHCHTPFSFLDGGSRIEDLVKRATELGMPAMAICDHGNVCAAVKFYKAATRTGIKPIQGVEVELENGGHLTLLARNNRGYASICSLLTRAHLSHPRGEAKVSFSDLRELREIIVLSGCRRGDFARHILTGNYKEAQRRAKEYLCIFKRDSFFIELQDNRLPGNRLLNQRLLQLAEYLDLQPVATNNVHYASHEDFIIHDLLTCVRTLSRVGEVSPLRPLNGERYIKSAREMEELFAFCPPALANTLHISEQCQPVFAATQTHFPTYELPAGQDAPGLLRQLTWEGARKRYGHIGSRVRQRLEYELDIIERMGYASYFLLVHDLTVFSRRAGIRYAGRGSAADSLVVYCLYISEVDSLERNLLFERFMNPERSELPDIDIDFEARHRDKVIDYVYRKYGNDKVARVATYNCFRSRSALRDIGKSLGFAEAELDTIAKSLPAYSFSDQIRALMDRLPELRNSPLREERFGLLLDICEKIAGFPRFLGTHLGGMVISDCPLQELTPLQQSALGPVITQFDKDDVEDLGLVKLDLLSLRTLSAVNDSVRYIHQTGQRLDYDAIPLDNQATYEMLAEGDTIGVFQLESPAQRALQARLGASRMEDIIASVALIRPGPIKGNMVEPYILRRQGQQEVAYLHPRLEPILKSTYGVVLFQEQVIEIANSIAGFSPGEADQLRRVMTHARSGQAMEEIGSHFIEKAVQNGIEQKTAAAIFACMEGYASYGFCEAHAAAFATTSFKTAYLLRHYPAQYYAAILNNQPMGYYPANIIGLEARRRGIMILPPDINLSHIDFTMEDGKIRVGLKQVKGISRGELDSMIEAREKAPFSSLQDIIVRSSLRQDSLENLIKCGAMDSLQSNRRYLLCQLSASWPQRGLLKAGQTHLLAPVAQEDFEGIVDFPPEETRWWEYQLLRMEIGEHFMSSFRPLLKQRNIKSSRELRELPHNSLATLCGLLLHPHRPPTRSGKITVFFSLEDEHGLSDVVTFEDIYMRYGGILFEKQKGPLLVKGRVQRKGSGVAVIAQYIDYLDI